MSTAPSVRFSQLLSARFVFEQDFQKCDEITFHLTPSPKIEPASISKLIYNGERPHLHDCQAEWGEFVSLCWAHDPAARPTAEAALELIAKLPVNITS